MESATIRPIDLFLDGWDSVRGWGQLVVRREASGFSLRHQADAGADERSLRTVTLDDLRRLCDHAASGAYRPLKSAPDLVSGWICRMSNAADLASALERIYPGALGDGWAIQTGAAQPADFESVARRQLGRGGVLRNLDSATLESVVKIVCTPSECLKHRRWSAAGVSAEAGDGKSDIPCLEPCALWLKFARACAKPKESDTLRAEFSTEDLRTIAAALRRVRSQPEADSNRGDVDAPLHPWRVARLIDRHAALWARAEATREETQDYAEP